MLKKSAALTVCLALLLCLAVPALGYTDSAQSAGDKLYTLGLVQGTENGLELDAAAQRCEAIALIIRLSGREQEALSGSWTQPFVDVPDWAAPYIGYGWAQGLVRGVDESHCAPEEPASANDFVTLVLRALGYDDDRGDFFWGSAVSTGYSLGLCRGEYAAFTRGDLFEIALSALTAAPGDGEDRLIDRLVRAGAVERARANALGLLSPAVYTARQASEKFAPAVFLLTGYFAFEDIAEGAHANTASGFFISPDGLAITNYHAIRYDKYVHATTIDGEIYSAERVLFADAEMDIAVLKFSPVSHSGQVLAAFPYLELAASDTVYTGDPVYTLSNPLGLTISISSGIVSNRSRTVEGFSLPMIQNTAAISTGSSGGALLNAHGQVIGVTSALYAYGQSMYLAVPMDGVLSADLSGEGETLAALAARDLAALEEEAD